ncbi:MAG: methylmalonyl-CoA mutase family protein, partial [Bdellovibrionaceae bacterium]|nr:methylmalonyl-CoA mutase family protein [Pseudobdellovibrionaceae bacterium]
MTVPIYQARHPIRIVTAASLFDGHDAAINMIRRLLQDSGAEVIHLGHNRSVQEIVQTALQEGAQGICVSSYQGGHMEFFKYMKDLLDEAGAGYVRIFGGGGGVIIHEEKKALQDYGIAYIFHPDDGRRMGLQGMINLILEQCDFSVVDKAKEWGWKKDFPFTSTPSRRLGLVLSYLEEQKRALPLEECNLKEFRQTKGRPLVFGVTGTGGAGKSSLIDELLLRFLSAFPTVKIAVLSVDPTKKKTGGALLGDRIRVNSASHPRIFMRSVASRGSGREVSDALPSMIRFCQELDFDLVIAETSGIGQSSHSIVELSDFSLYVMTAEFGSQSQLEKIDMIDLADFIAINKADRRGALDAVRDVTKQWRRSHKSFDPATVAPVFLTQASRFNDRGVHDLFLAITSTLKTKDHVRDWTVDPNYLGQLRSAPEHTIIPPHRQNYLAEIVAVVRAYKQRVRDLAPKASQLGALERIKTALLGSREEVERLIKELERSFTSEELASLRGFEDLQRSYAGDELVYGVRGKEVRQSLTKESLSHQKIPRVVVPQLNDWGERYRYLKLENVPGSFPYTAGVFPLKKQDEEPKRMFAGEGTPERTNQRFHFLCKNEKAHRLSTAFDSVTLYGWDPEERPDIFGKVGESGVSICTLENMKTLYRGFDLLDPLTSVSMTINGPAPTILAFFFNVAIDQYVEKREKELGRALTEQERQEAKAYVLQNVRGTVQADILKEDQGQNTCIFSTEFALKMMGDIQEYFIKNRIRNFYSVSISGYHIAEAGANPITQLAFTLSNGFTFVEYYLSRGMAIDDFCPNLSFFFSNGMDPEYTVLGRVARRIWAIAIRDKYGGNERSQKLKYHIQTSGRSLHAQEIAFNDIRTTLQALIAIMDHCNSLHTNAYDEAITTPTEESVRRAMAIQLIINREFGLTVCENPLQGSYFIEYLTDLVEEAVLDLFLKINERGGVLGAMEVGFQRARIQEESLHYETLKHSGA